MSSDIDIEEHDVMEHPSIKKIFPDLSWIKTEFVDLDGEEKEYRNVHNEQIIQEDQCDDMKQTDDTIIHEIPDSDSDCHTDEHKSLLTKNRIILGSNVPNKMIIGSNVPKKTKSHITDNISGSTETGLQSESRLERDPFTAKVILKDWGYILEKHPFYCDECLILFPSQSALHSHTASEHSLLVPIDQIEVEELQIESKQSVLGRNMLKCPVCGYVFKTKRNYMAHIESKHGTNKLQPIDGVFDGRCMLCPGKYFKTIHYYCKHISNCHAEVYHKKHSEIVPTKVCSSGVATKRTTATRVRRIAVKSTTRRDKLNYYICPICGIHCLHLWQYVAHCNTDHKAIYLSPKRHSFSGSCACAYETTDLQDLNNHISNEHRSLFKKIASDLQEYHCFECDTTFATLDSYNIHQTTHNCDLDEEENRSDRRIREAEDLSPLKEFETSGPKVGEAFILPKGTLFKCPLCDLHSMSSRTVFYHSLECTGAKSKVRCDVCERSLRCEDVESHRLQHQLMPTISAVEVTREAFYKLVLVCAECELGFDGFSISANHASECRKKEGTLCRKCNLKIAPECLIKHREIHSANGEPSIVEFLCGDVDKLKGLIEKNCLYYCHVCKSYDPAKHSCHSTGTCLQRRNFRICRFCGLRFSHESLAEHVLGHQGDSFDIASIKFVDVHTNEVMEPKIPEWNQVAGDAKYSGGKRKRDTSERTVYCEECQENYYELAYKIHLQYHESPSSNHIDAEIMQKYLTMQSLWNIVYLCRGCNISFDNYDLAVEHSQEHLTSSPKTPGERCTKCDLVFEKQSFERHRNLHCGAEIDERSLCVLSFNYQHLLTNLWDDLFGAISEEQRSHILSKSVYSSDRGLRLELNYDGPATLTLYKCAVCAAVVDKARLLEHAYDKDACRDRCQFSCSSCDLAFAEQDSLKEHESNHSFAGKSRIVLFNRPKHFSINNGLIQQLRASQSPNTKKSRSASLSTTIFYECVDCGSGIQSLLNIKKHTCSHRQVSRQYVKCELCKLWYRQLSLESHLLFHNKLDKFHVAPFQNGRLVLRGQAKLVMLYECNKCKICTLKKLPEHTCVPRSSRCVCKSCGLQFVQKSYRVHAALHENLPNLARNHFIVIQYSPDWLTSHKPLTKKSAPLPNEPSPDDPMTRFLYKCICNNLFMKWEKLREHVKKCNGECNASTRCECGLNFHSSSLEDHLSVHCNCASIKSYLVASVVVGRAAMERSRKKWLWYCTSSKTYYNNIKNLMCHFKRNKAGPSDTCAICEIKLSRDSFQHHMALHREDRDFDHTQLHKLVLRMIDADSLKTSEPRDPVPRDRPCLYECEACDVYFSSRCQLESHLSGSHQEIKDRVQCNICKYSFAKIYLPRHKHKHHYRKKYKRQDFIIIRNCLPKAKERRDIESPNSTIGSSRAADSRRCHDDFAKKPKNAKSMSQIAADALTLHRCGKCDLHFMLKKSLKTHMSRHSTTKTKFHSSHVCSICGLAFLGRSLARHVILHHKTLKLEVQDFNIRVYTAPHVYTVTKIPKKPKPTKRRMKSVRVEHAKERLVPAKPQPEANENVSQIFRCADCKVCFTNYEMCYDHTSNHKPLDSTEYIGCNLCDFQFLCECLGVHRKGHREGTFTMEGLIVRQFRPRDGAPAITTHLARDLLEANVTSTTTNGTWV